MIVRVRSLLRVRSLHSRKYKGFPLELEVGPWDNAHIIECVSVFLSKWSGPTQYQEVRLNETESRKDRYPLFATTLQLVKINSDIVNECLGLVKRHGRYVEDLYFNRLGL